MTGWCPCGQCAHRSNQATGTFDSKPSFTGGLSLEVWVINGWSWPLTHPDATQPPLAGAKAANLALSAHEGLPIVPGFVITTVGVQRGLTDPEVSMQVRAAWKEIGGESGRPLVVRSSSTIEDAGASSMAGRFTSVLDVVSWDSFLAAAERVVASGDAVRDADGVARPIAVLVQQQLRTQLGGVMFAVDPVSGRRDHLVVEVVRSRPDSLVGGTVNADHYVLSRRGRVLEHASSSTPVPLHRGVRRRLASLARTTSTAFGCPQDVEWAVDDQGTLRLLQTRPVTAVALHDEAGVVLGPGPVAETFPAPLSLLETDIWIAPLRTGIIRALRATGAVAAEAIDRSPVVTTVGGWAAVDLELLGTIAGRRSFRRRISLGAIVRRLGAAWRVGRLRVALPRLTESIVATVDRDLAQLPPLHEMASRDLVDLMRQTSTELATVHAYEVLSGMLLRPGPGEVPAPLVALAALHAGRSDGRSDEEIVYRDPVTLALTTPALFGSGTLPDDAPASVGATATLTALSPRDALRLRARWLQELHCRAVEVIADRLVEQGRLPERRMVAMLSIDELAAVVSTATVPDDLLVRARRSAGPPLPAAFRLSPSGQVHETRHGRPAHTSGLPAGGGRAWGEARHRVKPGTPKGDIILVTRHLEPQLASILPSLAGLVAETGSALSHLAILAREMGVPTVVGVDGALHRFPPGTRLLVDGSTGVVEIVDDCPAPLPFTTTAGVAT